MAPKPDSNDESLPGPLDDDCLRDAAAKHPVTVDEVAAATVDMQEALESQLTELYDDAWIKSGAETYLAYNSEGVFFAMVPADFNRKWGEDVDVDFDRLMAAFDAYEALAEVWGFTVDQPTSYADNLVDDLDYQPVFVAFPDGWTDALYHARQHMMYLLQHDLTPAEALDFWALKQGPSSLSSTEKEDQWVASRGVEREAVYKTIRQAREKYNDDEHRPYYPQQNIEITEIR